MSVQSVGRRASELFFTRDGPISPYWKCHCGKRRKKGASSYENLLSHVRTAHPEYKELLEVRGDINQLHIDRFFEDNRSNNYYGWFDMVLNGLLPFSFVEIPVARRNVRHEPMSLSTFMRYLPKLAELVEGKIAKMLPDLFALVFDGWSAGCTYFLIIYAFFADIDKTTGYSLRLLTFSPMGDESSLDATEHYELITFILELYGKSWDNVVSLVGDNCNTNKDLANLSSVPLIGCASHRFNLAVKLLLSDHESLIDKVNGVIHKLKTLTLVAKLQRLAGLRAKTKNVPRWSSVFHMSLQYEKIKDHLSDLCSDDLDNLRLTCAKMRSLSMLLIRLKDLESVNKALQHEETTMDDARVMFDAVIDMFPTTASKLLADASIVHSGKFETAICKVQLGNQGALQPRERASISVFAPTTEIQEENENLSLSEVALKRQKLIAAGRHMAYSDMRFLLPTSNVCERLFSKAGYTFTDRRRGMLPSNFESQIFLNLNSELWNATDIARLRSE